MFILAIYKKDNKVELDVSKSMPISDTIEKQTQRTLNLGPDLVKGAINKKSEEQAERQLTQMKIDYTKKTKPGRFGRNSAKIDKTATDPSPAKTVRITYRPQANASDTQEKLSQKPNPEASRYNIDESAITQKELLAALEEKRRRVGPTRVNKPHVD